MTLAGPPRHRHAVLALIATVTLDRAVTLPHWSHEANPIVTAIGPGPWLALTGACLVAAAVLWYRYGIHRHRGMVWLTYGMAGLHGLAVVTNAGVVTGVL